MIQSLSIKNFLSFKDEVTISFEATKDDHLEDYHVVEVAPGVKLLKFLVVYGYNASGKSNLIQAFNFLREFLLEVKEQKTHFVQVIPFALDNETMNKPTEFTLTFYVGHIRHVYSVRMNSREVIYEELDFYPGSQPANIFERVTQNGISKIAFGSKLKVSKLVKEEITLKCLPNMSVFAAYNQVNTEIPKLSGVFNWILNQYFEPIEPNSNLKDFAKNLIYDDHTSKNQILNYLKRADFNVSDIVTKEMNNEEWEKILSEMKARGVSDEDIRQYKQRMNQNMRRTEFTHSVIKNGKETTFTLSLPLQSEGTIRIFGLSGAVYEAIRHNAFLAIDEVESKLHPHLIEFLIEEFLKEPGKAQMLVATHYDNLFDQEDLLRKDNFWFTEKGKDGATKVYPLSAFKGLNRISSLQKAYKFGKFGAVPDIEE
ncbi:MAG: AAA family ATPase [Bacteroidota bacterium]